ncbi:hypothetical protein K3248_01855 [Candidatus Bartonella raoultii]|uniref:Uncharacterized protein n=1 Tax=Bartonella raoultii TaxID=1457020 RepID=A0ABS7I4Z4_9HYPH|nr:hypothetical protein [Bartonella raoultii]
MVTSSAAWRVCSSAVAISRPLPWLFNCFSSQFNAVVESIDAQHKR